MKKKLFLLLLLFSGVSVLFAQRIVTGTVRSASNGESIIGASITVKGAPVTAGAVTDVNGNFAVTVPAGLNTIIVSSTGMKKEEVNVSNTSIVDISLKEDILNLEGVVVTGYGVQRKAAFTGAATSIDEELVTKKSGANVISNLQGVIPGVQISVTSGSPGSSSPVLMRGLGSIGSSSEPLFIIDGVPAISGDYSTAGGQSVDALSLLNPEDVESISFLKDAAATSIYGSRASNGVIVITTKKGKIGKPSVSFGVRLGFNDKPYVRKNFQLLSKEDYIEMLRTSLRNGGLPDNDAMVKSFYDIDPNDPTNEDWWDAVTRKGIIQDYNISVSGGTAENKYYVSGNFLEDKGSIIGSGTQRYALRVNLESNISKYFTIENNISGSYSRTDGPMSARTTGDDQGVYYANPIFAARSNLPFQPVKNDDGSWNFKTSAGGHNPVAEVSGDYHDIRRTDLYRAIYSPTIRANILKDLFVQVKGGVTYLLSHGTTVMNPEVNPDAKVYNGVGEDQRYQKIILMNTNTINWMPQFGKHSLNILLGQESQKEMYSGAYAVTGEYPNYKMLYSLGNGAMPLSAGGGNGTATLLSFFSNAEYSYDDKYYFSASFREDGSSKFIGKNKWGAFYSVGAKYRITQENFMRGTEKWLQNLTFRISYGSTGNQDVLSASYFPAMGLYGFGASYYGNPVSYPDQLPNIDLTWESRNKFNVGLDITLFDRLGIEIDYFYDVVYDMLNSVPITGTTGFSSIYRNVGDMSNTGVEAMFNVLLVKTKNVVWTANFNLTHYKNKVLKLVPDSLIRGASLSVEGLPWRSIWVRNFGGIYTESGEPYYILADGSTTTDIEEANKAENRIFVGSSNPDLYGGFGTRLDFYGFDLSAQFAYRIGGYGFNDAGQWNEWTDLGVSTPGNITYYAWENSWKNPGDNASLPAIKYNRSQDWFYALWSKEHLHSLSYLKMSNLTVGYTLSKKLVSKALMSNVRIYFSCDNVFSIYDKSYRGFDTDPNGMAQEDFGFVYPTSRRYLFGLNITF